MSSLTSVMVGTFQMSAPSVVAAAVATCESCIHDFSGMNAAVEDVLHCSSLSAASYCKTVGSIVWRPWNDLISVVTRDTISLILTAMRSHPDVYSVQYEGCWALAGIVYLDRTSIPDVLSLDGVHLLCTAADTYLGSFSVQKWVCDALFWIAALSGASRAALRSGRATEVATRARVHYSTLDTVVEQLMLTLTYAS